MTSLRVALVVAMLSLHVLYVTALTDQQLIDSINIFMNNLVEDERLIGVSLAVTKDSEPLMTQGYGTTELSGDTDVTDLTPFYLGEVTQTFTATLLDETLNKPLQPRNMESPIHEMDADFFLKSGYRTNVTSSRDLLAARTGVPDSPYGWVFGELLTRLDCISRARFYPSLYPLRGHHSASDTLSTEAGRVCGDLANKRWEDLLHDSLLQPLLMSDTEAVYDADQEMRDAMARPYLPDYTTGALLQVPIDLLYSENQRPVGPSTGLISTARDMLKYLLMFMRDGMDEFNVQVIDPAVIEEVMFGTAFAFAASAPTDPDLPIKYTETGMAPGYVSGYYRGYRMATLTTERLGSCARVTLLPDLGLSVYTAINGPDGQTDGDAMMQTFVYIADLILDNAAPAQPSSRLHSPGGAPSGRSTEGAVIRRMMPSPFSNRKRDEAPVSQDSDSMQERDFTMYEGVYGNYAFGNLTVAINDVTTLLEGSYGVNGVMVLERIMGDTFLGFWQYPMFFMSPETVTFSIQVSVAESVIIPGFLPEDPPVFERDLNMNDAPPPSADC